MNKTIIRVWLSSFEVRANSKATTHTHIPLLADKMKRFVTATVHCLQYTNAPECNIDYYTHTRLTFHRFMQGECIVAVWMDVTFVSWRIASELQPSTMFDIFLHVRFEVISYTQPTACKPNKTIFPSSN